MSNHDDNRVLSRRGARIMTENETASVNGGIRTLTACTADPQFGVDGDAFSGDCLYK